MAKEDKVKKEKPTCFIIMPITTPKHLLDRYYNDDAYFKGVLNGIFIPAVEKAEFEPIPPIAKGTQIILEHIFDNVEKADMVLCDISALNANVFLELGARIARNKPMCLVRDSHTKIPFDSTGIHIEEYPGYIRPNELKVVIDKIAGHIGDAVKSCNGGNPFWKFFGPSSTPAEPVVPTKEDYEARKINQLDTLVDTLRSEITSLRKQVGSPPGLTKELAESIEFVHWMKLIRHFIEDLPDYLKTLGIDASFVAFDEDIPRRKILLITDKDIPIPLRRKIEEIMKDSIDASFRLTWKVK